MHYFQSSQHIFNLSKYVDNEWIVDLGHSVVPEMACIIREADIVITDYSSVFTEAMFLGKPILGFVYDYDHYGTQEDGFIYDMGLVFPGPLARTFGELLQEIESEFINGQGSKTEKYRFIQKFFYDYLDGNNSSRVVERVKKLLPPV